MIDPTKRLPLWIAAQYVADMQGCSRTSARNWIEMEHPGYDPRTGTVVLVLPEPNTDRDRP